MKVCGIVGSPNKRGTWICIRTAVDGFMLWANVGLDEVIAYAHDSVELGSVKQDEQRMQRAFDIGVRVVGEIGGI